MLIERAERGDRVACFGGFPVDTAHGLGQCAVVHRGNFSTVDASVFESTDIVHPLSQVSSV